jgi:hypothetical protein
MALKTNSVKIGEYEINIIQFNALEALKLRKELIESVKKQVGDDISFGENSANILKAVAGLVYEIPSEMFLKLFKNCSALDVGGLDNQTNFNKVFEDNLDGPIELAMEVLDINGFFSLNIVSILVKKIPILAPMEAAIMEALKDVKKS